MGIATQRAHAEAVVALKRTSQFLADCRVARSFKIDKKDGTAECGCEDAGALAGQIGHRARPARGREREKKLAFGFERGEPSGQGMRSAGAGDNGVGWIERPARSVGMHDGDLGPWLQSHPSPGCESLVNFDCDDVAMPTNKLCEDGRVIPRSATKMKNRIAGMNVKQAEMKSPKAGLTVVDAPGGIENDQRIPVEIVRIDGFSEGLRAAVLDRPRRVAREALPRNGGERGKNGWRRDTVKPAEFLGEKAPRGFD